MLVVVGGAGRKVGKTAVIAGLIRALPGRNWTAVKITDHPHGIRGDAPSALRQETQPGHGDSGRYLEAGAARAYALETAMGQLAPAVPELLRLLETSENAIVESNRILDYLLPGLCLLVLAPAGQELKQSVRRHLSRADAFVLVDHGPGPVPRPDAVRELPGGRRLFHVHPPSYASEELVAYVAERLQPAQGKPTKTDVP